MAYSTADFAEKTRFLVKGDASTYEVEFVTDDGKIKAINLSTGTSGLIPISKVVKVLQRTTAEIEPKSIEILDELPSKKKVVRRKRKTRFEEDE